MFGVGLFVVIREGRVFYSAPHFQERRPKCSRSAERPTPPAYRSVRTRGEYMSGALVAKRPAVAERDNCRFL